MKIAVFTSSPNKEGLTAACGKAANQGALDTGAELLNIDLNSLKLSRCDACGNGWGQCRREHTCYQTDDFNSLHEQISGCDAYIIITPVYWGEMSEPAKIFFDKLRRCEAWKKEQSMFYNKPCVAVAAAGGSGNGIISCLESFERLFKHVGANIFDLIAITQKSRSYKLDTIRSCVREIGKLK